MEEENAKWCLVSIRIESDELDPNAISERLGARPDFQGEAGRHLNDNPKYFKRTNHLWGWNCPLPNTTPPAEMLEAALQWVEARRDPWLEMLNSSETAAELFVGYGSNSGQGGFHLSPEMLRRMADLQLFLDLDLYPPEEFES